MEGSIWSQLPVRCEASCEDMPVVTEDVTTAGDSADSQSRSVIEDGHERNVQF